MPAAKIFLFGSETLPAALIGTKNASDDFVQVADLQIATADLDVAPGDDVQVPLSVLEKISTTEEHYRFRPDVAFNRTIELNLVDETFLGWLVSVAGQVDATITIHVPAPGQTDDQPFVTLEVCGTLAFAIGPFFSREETVCFTFSLEVPPTDFALPNLPLLDVSLPDVGFKLPSVRLPKWDFPDFPNSPFEFPRLDLESTDVGQVLPLVFKWEKLSIGHEGDPTTGTTRLKFKHLQVASHFVPDVKVDADVTLVFTNGTDFSPGASEVKLYQPDADNLVPIDLSGLHFDADARCLVLDWGDPNINYWLGKLAPDFLDQSERRNMDMACQIVWGDEKEIRLDWAFSGTKRTFKLPGVGFETPDNPRFTIVLQPDDENLLRNLAFLLNFNSSEQAAAFSNFAWERPSTEGMDRELQNDDEQDAIPRLLELTAIAKRAVTLVLFQWTVGGGKLPTFFQELTDPLARLDLDNDDTLCTLVPLNDVIALRGASWDITFDIDTDAAPFKFPFLKSGDGKFGQFLTIEKKAVPAVKVDDKEVTCPFDVAVEIGDLSFATEIILGFNWETFALIVEHGKGIDLVATKDAFETQKHLGLEWRLKGALISDNNNINDGKHHYFTLVTQDNNYQLQQAPSSVLEIDYTKASAEPITFAVSKFVVSPKGINLTAEVTDRPAKLNSIDTRFRFGGTKLEIVENLIKGFTLRGSGPLPPALVGDATADIALQFEQKADGNLDLVAGGAQLKGTKLLDAKSTHFQFQVDAIGLKFVNDGKFHLYFTISGSAGYIPAPSEKDGPLALLSKIKIQLIECPLTGDASVIAKHVKFLIELPEAVEFRFFGCFTFELRAIGFVPQAEVFDGDAAMQITGQVKFAEGNNDTNSAKVDFHGLFIGVPSPGSILPRLHLEHLAVEIKYGEAFKLTGAVSLVNNDLRKGFMGQGAIQIKGLPTIAASFAFLRVRRDENDNWLRAWFIYLEVQQVSFRIPFIEIYLREIGLGFGYRYTLTAIKASDQANDVRQLLQDLKKLSRTAGDLSQFDRWAVDIEDRGQDVRWTIVLRAMFSQTSASASPLKWNPSKEKDLACVFLFDAIIAFRSDLTFFMAVRAWLNTNYHDFVTDNEGLRDKPLLSGFIHFSPHKKRLLANISSNPDGKVGPHPPLPDFVKAAIASAEFSITLLIEPGLFHYEMGWPNMLRWKQTVGPLEAEFQGGFIFRISTTEGVIGQSFLARGKMAISATLDLGLVGARISALAEIAYGARYIGVLDFVDPKDKSAFYGAIGLDVRIHFALELWIKIPLLFKTIKLTFRFSFTLTLTASLEVGLVGVPIPAIGLRGRGTVAVSVMGHSLGFSVKIGFQESNVTNAFNLTSRFLNVGLEATDVEPVPGTQTAGVSLPAPAAAAAFAPSGRGKDRRTHRPDMTILGIPPPDFRQLSQANGPTPAAVVAGAAFAQQAVVYSFEIPNYSIFVIHQPAKDGWIYFVLLPQGETENTADDPISERGFLPTPPVDFVTDPAFATNLDAGTVSAGLDTAFRVHGAELTGDVSVTVETAGASWTIMDAGHGRSFTLSKETEMVDGAPQDQLRVSLVVDDDFTMNIPVDDALTGNDTSMLQQFGQNGQWDDSWDDRHNARGTDFSWSVNWDAAILSADTVDQVSGEVMDAPSTGELNFTLREYLRNGYRTQDVGRDVIPIADPAPIVDPDDENNERSLEDERVHNPTDDSFEAAVRGAVEQFRGSPFFKKDPNSEYENRLSLAFNDNTNVYASDGSLLTDDGTDKKVFDPVKAAEAQKNEQAYQLRGMVIHDIIADLQDVVEALNQGEGSDRAWEIAQKSIPFQMGLVFRTQGAEKPAWLERAFDGTVSAFPSIFQRSDPVSNTPDTSKARRVTTFNIPRTNFEIFAPQFQRIRQFSDATTIALAWDLVWENTPDVNCTRCQADPDHHLMHYEVRRRALDGTEPEVVFTAKSAETLHKEEGILHRLMPRFQMVDRFTDETLEDQAALPTNGRSYLYTVTPTDFALNQGRPLTIVATRFPNQPPQVPVNAELTVDYRLPTSVLDPAQATEPLAPKVVEPQHVYVQWSEPVARRTGPDVPIDIYRLIFRKDNTLPVGSYGLDGSVQGPRHKSLPTSNARPLPTDVKIELTPLGSRRARRAIIDIAELRRQRVLPLEDNPTWQPEAWSIFFQTVSPNKVPSALAPVQLVLRVQDSDPANNDDIFLEKPEREERRPAQLEWLPLPVKFPLLPPKDQRATVGTAHFPMPVNAETIPFDVDGSDPSVFHFDGAISNVSHQLHPAGIRTVRFRWNQGPSDQPDYPLSLNAGYELLQLDIDAHPADLFRDKQRLADALRRIQEVQMLPKDDLLLVPGDTLTTSQWECWYPSTMIRTHLPEERAAAGSETTLGPWYSWRDSYLEWPAWDGLTNDPVESAELLDGVHPFLKKIIDALHLNPDGLKEVKDGKEVEIDTYIVDLQFSPPIQAQDLATFFANTAPTADLYGWGVLQRFGLSVAFSLRNKNTSDVLDQSTTLDAVHKVINAYRVQESQYLPFLHVELLFQPSQSVELKRTAAEESALLAIVQVSLRPAIHQYLKYASIDVQGLASTAPEVTFSGLELDTTYILIDQNNTSVGEIKLEATDQKPIKQAITLPPSGQTTLLLRCRGSMPLPSIDIIVPQGTEPEDVAKFSVSQPELFIPSDERATYFTTPVDNLAKALASGSGVLKQQWTHFKCYVENLNPTDDDTGNNSGNDEAPKISVPTAEADIKILLPDFLGWALRFFDYGAPVVPDEVTKLGTTPLGPWLATAYPRSNTPGFVTPDESGRLTYDHLLADRWAHNYRYYIRPFGRYDLLWQSLRQSPALFPQPDEGANLLPVATPEPYEGALDVVIDRTQPVTAPLVLSATRLDPPANPGAPVPPGTTWEVIVAQHPEQALIERNQILFRQLSYRGIAFTLLRRFAFAAQIDQLQTLIRTLQEQPDYTIAIRYVEDAYPDSLPALPEQPDHIELSNASEDEIRSLALPQRLGDFQQGAIALQWEAIPYFYEHRLLLVAQTATTVSGINEVTQRDFDYISPEPDAIAQVFVAPWHLEGPTGGTITLTNVRVRQVQLPLKRFWDCLPDGAPEQWSAEEPDPANSTAVTRTLSSLPDLEIVYQIVTRFSGNVEVQSELFFDGNSGTIARRQLGQQVLTEFDTVLPAAAGAPQSDFLLQANLLQVGEVELTRAYTLPTSSPHLVISTQEGKHRLRIFGLFSKVDRDALINVIINQLALRAIEDDGAILLEMGSAPALDPLSEGLRAKVSYPELPSPLRMPTNLSGALSLSSTGVVWAGAMLPRQRAAIETYHLNDRPVFRTAITQLLVNIDGIVFTEAYTGTVLRPRPDDSLPGTLEIAINYPPDGDPTNGNWTLRWTGSITDTQKTALRDLNGDSDFRQGVNRLIAQIEATTPDLGDVFTAQISFVWLRRRKSELTTLMDHDLSSLTVPNSGSIRWQGASLPDLSVEELKALARERLPVGDPFIAAFENLLDQITGATFGVAYTLPRILRSIAPLTEAERNELRGIFSTTNDQTRIDNLYDAWPDKETIEELYRDGFNQVAVSVPLSTIPDVVNDRVDFPDPSACILIWTGTMSETASTNLLALAGDDLFKQALQKLAAAATQVTAPTTVTTVDAPLGLDQMPTALQNRIEVGAAEDTYINLNWTGGLILDDDAVLLRQWSQIPIFMEAIETLIDDGKMTTVEMNGNGPTQAELPPLLQTKLTLDATEIAWQGRIENQGQFNALNELPGDTDFKGAIQALINQLSQDATVAFQLPIPIRATVETVNAIDTLKDNLLIGRSLIRYHGLMTIKEGQALRDAYVGQPDQDAIQRLYDASISQGLRGREILIRTRRGSATPSSMVDLATRALE